MLELFLELTLFEMAFSQLGQPRSNSHRCPIRVSKGVVRHINFEHDPLMFDSYIVYKYFLSSLSYNLFFGEALLCVCAIFKINVTWCNILWRNSKTFIHFKCILIVQMLLGDTVYNKSVFFINNKPIRSGGKRTPRADVYSHNVWIDCFCDLKNDVQLVPFTL